MALGLKGPPPAPQGGSFFALGGSFEPPEIVQGGRKRTPLNWAAGGVLFAMRDPPEINSGGSLDFLEHQEQGAPVSHQWWGLIVKASFRHQLVRRAQFFFAPRS